MSTTRAEVEELFYREAALLDGWRLDEWLGMLTDDACYYVPPNDKPDADHHDTLFTIADNNARLKERVKRITDPNCHAEQPRSRTHRLIGNVRITRETGGAIEAEANFILHRFRRGEDVRVFIGRYRYKLRRVGTDLKIAERRAILDAEELGAMGAVSFIL